MPILDRLAGRLTLVTGTAFAQGASAATPASVGAPIIAPAPDLPDMDFVLIDVETARGRSFSICEIGIVGFAGGQEVLAWETLVDPQDVFTAFNTRLHGIGARRPMLALLAGVVEQVRAYDRQLRAITREHQVGRRLMTLAGVGYLAALAFLSTIEDSTRFKRSAEVGLYLGVTPRIYRSGEIGRSGGSRRPATPRPAATWWRPPTCCW